MKQEPPSTFDQAILSAWQDELKATRNPTIKQQCLEREQELSPRFAEHYQQFKALRQRVRRSVRRQWKRFLVASLANALGQTPR